MGVTLTKLSEAHFVKSRMNVKLAVQVFSTTMFKLCTVTLPARDPEMFARMAGPDTPAGAGLEPRDGYP